MHTDSAPATPADARVVPRSRSVGAARPAAAATRGGRLPEARWVLAFDGALALVAYVLVLTLRSEEAAVGFLGPFSRVADASMVVLLAVTFAVMALFGLYEKEIFVSRAVHLWTLLKALGWAFIVSVALVYVFKLPVAFDSRFVVVGGFALFLVLVVALRIWLLAVIVGTRLRDKVGPTLLVGEGRAAASLKERLAELKGFHHVQVLKPASSDLALRERFALQLGARAGMAGATGFANVVIDAGSLSPKTAIDLAGQALRAGVNVYVVSDLLNSLNCRKLLYDLFQAPVVRLRRRPDQSAMTVAKRAFDIAAATVLMLLGAPFMLAVAVLVKITSKGPVLYAQERVGRRGRPFTFYKLRSMAVGCDAHDHKAFTRDFIRGNGHGGRAADRRDGQTLYKLADDPRVTRLGRFLRKYSLDELPQLWNVLTGDMSLVGPRPPLAYEVAEYKEWHRQRLEPAPGVSGLWQVQGRSRVTFDEMVFQDVMYGCARDVVVDAMICLRTVPAALIGHGAR